MKHIFILILLLQVLWVSGQSPKEKLTLALRDNYINFPKNKVFLKTDKDIYAPGEKIWFKAEVLNCLTERGSTEPNLVLMVKAESGEVIVDNKYMIEMGVVNNQIGIPSWAPEGNAFLIAYTPNAVNVNEASLAAIQPITINRLKNHDFIISATFNKELYAPGEDLRVALRLNAITPTGKRERVIFSVYDYHKLISSEKRNINVNQTNEIEIDLPSKVENGLYLVIETQGRNSTVIKKPIYTVDDRIKVEFFPEGGDLLTSSVQRIVYRATDPFGNPTDISGVVYDAIGNQVGLGKAMKPGFGMISLLPAPNQKYTFKLDTKYGKNQSFVLPMVNSDGCALSLIKAEKEVIRMVLNNSGNTIGKKVTVSVVASGKLLYGVEFDAKQKNTLNFNTRELPEGIINFVVINSDGKVLSERLIYNTPFEDIDIDLDTKVEKVTDDEMKLTVDAAAFVEKFGNSKFDIRIVDKQNLYHIQNVKTRCFLKYPLLSPIPKTVLDIFITNIELIANYHRYYTIQDLLDGYNYMNDETSEITISGTVVDKDGYPVGDATVMVAHPDNLSMLTTKANENGRFVFKKMADNTNLVVRAVSPNGKKSFNVKLDRSFDETLDEMLLIESFKVKPLYSADTTPEYFKANSSLLKQIGTENKDARPDGPSDALRLLESGSSVLEVVRMIKPFNIKDNQVVFYGGTNSLTNQQGALIVVDGQKMGTSIDVLNNLNPHEVYSVNVSTNAVDIQRYTGLNSVGLIEVRTKGGVNTVDKFREEKKEEEVVDQFNYTLFSKDNWKYQTTLLWAPGLQPDPNGKFVVQFKTSEIKSDFKVEVEAISQSGKRHVFHTEFSTR